MPVVWNPDAQARAAPRRWPGRPLDPRATADACVHEVEELARRWNEEAERDVPLGPRWVALRAMLSASDEGAYAAACTAADALGPRPLGFRCALAYAFPHDPERAAALAREVLAMPHVPKCALKLLPSLAEPELATKVALGLADWPRLGVSACAYDLVASMGDSAAPVLITLLDALKEQKSRTPLLGALMLVQNDAVAKWFAAHLDKTAVRRHAAEYFRAAPHLKVHLAAEGKKRGVAGRAAKTLSVTDPPAEAGDEVATPEELPAVLRNPPWRGRTRWPAGLVVKDAMPILPLAGTVAERATWAERMPWIPPAHAVASGAAWAVVHAFFERDDAREVTRQWLHDFAEVATVGLVPMVVGKDSRKRNAARVLRMLVAEGKAAEVRRGIARYPASVAAVANAVVALDPSLDVPMSPPTMPAVLSLDSLPAPRLRSGKRLPPLAARAVAELLAITSDGFPYVGTEEVRAACEETSLEGYAWALYEAWEAAGCPTKTRWPLQALATFGGDAVARELGPRLRGWAQKREMERAMDGVDVLGALGLRGNHVALVQLAATSEGTRFAQLGVRARGHLDAAARQRGLDREQLCDRLEASPGSPVDVEALDRVQVKRFEMALRVQRRFGVRELEDVLMRRSSIARRLVWTAMDEHGRPVTSFRIAEDGTCADPSDSSVDLAAIAFVCVAHPLHMTKDAIVRWSQILTDYEVVQPFQQLAREVFTLTDEERNEASLARFNGKKVAARDLFALEHHGWGRTGDWYWCEPAPKVVAGFGIEPGLSHGSWSDQTMGPLTLARLGTRQPVTFGSLDPVACSEMLRDLASLP